MMTRTTIDLDNDVLVALKARGRRERKSLGAVASQLLARALDDDAAAVAAPFAWTAKDLGIPRVDLEDKDAVWATLDGGAEG